MLTAMAVSADRQTDVPSAASGSAIGSRRPSSAGPYSQVRWDIRHVSALMSCTMHALFWKGAITLAALPQVNIISVDPHFLEGNATSHKRSFSAVAELVSWALVHRRRCTRFPLQRSHLASMMHIDRLTMPAMLAPPSVPFKSMIWKGASRSSSWTRVAAWTRRPCRQGMSHQQSKRTLAAHSHRCMVLTCRARRGMQLVKPTSDMRRWCCCCSAHSGWGTTWQTRNWGTGECCISVDVQSLTMLEIWQNPRLVGTDSQHVAAGRSAGLVRVPGTAQFLHVLNMECACTPQSYLWFRLHARKLQSLFVLCRYWAEDSFDGGSPKHVFCTHCFILVASQTERSLKLYML